MTVDRHLILQQKVFTPSAEWQPASEGWLALRIAEGQGYLLAIGSAARPVAAGDVLIIGPGGGSVLRASQLGPMKLHFFTVLPQMLSGVLTIGEGHQLETAPKTPGQTLLAFAATDAIGLKFTALVARAGDHLPDRCTCLQIWSEGVAMLLTETPAPTVGNDNLRERFRLLVGQIPEAELATHSLAGLAAQLHCSERHFSRLFREEFGVSLRARQIELRLQRARQLLTNTNAKIINVAYESGYHHLGLFNAMFKRRFEVTPSEWRQQNLQRGVPAHGRGLRPARARLGSRMATVFLLFSLGLGLPLMAQSLAGFLCC